MNLERKYSIIKSFHLSEKSNILAEKRNQYVFKVDHSSTKLEIKKAVESLFNVSVLNVQVINEKGKTKRNRFGLRKEQDIKKAIVKLSEGNQIDFSAVN